MAGLSDFLKSRRLYYIYKLHKNKMNAKKSYLQIEKIIGRKYKKIFGRCIDWDMPTSYTEKLNYSKLYNGSAEKTRLSDKYEVREWVKEKIGEQYLIPILGVFDDYSQIDFSILPESFVIKCNHDSGSVTVVHDKELINHRKLKRFYDFCLNRNYAYNTFEVQYKDIKPRIIIESLLQKEKSGDIEDYKFLCFNGEPMFCWVDVDRFSNHRRRIYDMQWNPQEFKQCFDFPDNEIERPQNFDELLRIARILCEGIDHVRVDLYSIKGKVYFGEMTFSSGTGYERITPDYWDLKLGELWELQTLGRNLTI